MLEILSKWGLEVISAENAKEALEKLSHAPNLFDLILMDHEMPEMLGLEAIRIIRRDLRIRDVQIILLPASGTVVDAEERKELGIRAVMPRPVNVLDLFDSLILVKKRKEDQAREQEGMLRSLLPETSERRILLVEDHPINQKLAVALLQKRSFTVEVADNGRAALDKLRSSRFDLILMDIQMPIMDGLEATRIIRDPSSNVPWHEIPIIAMTAHAMTGDREMCLKTGMDGYISKPVTANDLFNEIRRVLEKREVST